MEKTMRTRMQWTASMLTALAGLLTPLAHAHASIADEGVSAVLSRATEALSDGRAVEARELLVPLASERAGVSMSDDERSRVVAMAATAAKRVKGLPPLELSLQTAEWMVTRDDLLAAEQHARAVEAAPKATNEQAGRARGVLASIATRREAILARAGSMLDEASGALDLGRVAEGKEAVALLARSGVSLDAPDWERLVVLQARVVAMEESSSPVAYTSAMQPGVVKPRNPGNQPPSDQPPPGEPQPEPQPEPVANEPMAIPDMQPVEPAPPPPELTPVVVQAPAPSQPSGEADAMRLAQQYTAQNLMAQADQAFAENRMNEASAKYQRLLAQFAEYLTTDQANHARTRLAEANVLLGRGAREITQDVLANREVARQNALAEFNNFLSQSQGALDGGDVERARTSAASAGIRLSQARTLFSEGEYEGMLNRQRDMLAEIDRRAETIRKADLDRNTQAVKAAIERQAASAQQVRDRQIRENIDRVRALQMELKYDEALQVVDQILFLDPLNPTGLLLRDVLTDAMLYRRGADLKRTLTYGVARQSLDNEEATLPPPWLVNYPTDWPAVSNRRGTPISFQEPEENRRVLASLATKRIPTVAFKENSLRDCLGFIQTVTQQNMDVDWASLESVGIDPERQVTLNLTNVPVNTVLDRLVSKASEDPETGAAWGVIDGMLTVASRETINKNRTIHIYDIKDLLIQIPNFIDAPEFDLTQVLQSRRAGGGGGGGGGNNQGPFQGRGNQNPPDNRPLEERIQELVRIITSNVDRSSWVENGGDVGRIQQFQGNLIVTQTPSNHRTIHGLLGKLREQRAMQINVETRFLLVSQEFFEQIGVDIDVYFNAGNNQVRAARATRPGTLPSDFFDFSAGGIQRDILGRTATATTPGLAPVRVANPSPLSVIGAGQNSLGLTESLITSDFGNQIIGQAPALGVAGQFLDDIQVDFLVKATQADTRTVSLTAPRLTFTNGQTANIVVATQTAFVSDLDPVVSESAVGFDPTLETISDGVRLLVEGTVSADRRYVTLTVDTAVARLERFNSVAVTAVAGGQLVNSAQTSSFIQLPVITVTQARTTVTVPDQGTVLLGGQRLVTNSEVESGVPVLSKVPFLNRFFTNRVEVKEEQTLIILIKPTILIQNEEEERNFPGLNEAIRAGYGG